MMWKEIDSAPKDCLIILASIGQDNSTPGYWEEEGSRWVCPYGFPFPATHWMPLPEPPNVQK